MKEQLWAGNKVHIDKHNITEPDGHQISGMPCTSSEGKVYKTWGIQGRARCTIPVCNYAQEVSLASLIKL